MKLLLRDRKKYFGTHVTFEKGLIGSTPGGFGLVFKEPVKPVTRSNSVNITRMGKPVYEPSRSERNNQGLPSDPTRKKLANTIHHRRDPMQGLVGYTISPAKKGESRWMDFLPTWRSAVHAVSGLTEANVTERHSGMDAVMGFVLAYSGDESPLTGTHRENGTFFGPMVGLADALYGSGSTSKSVEDSLALVPHTPRGQDTASEIISFRIFGAYGTSPAANSMGNVYTDTYRLDKGYDISYNHRNQRYTEAQFLAEMCLIVDAMGDLLDGNNVPGKQDLVNVYVSSTIDKVTRELGAVLPQGSGCLTPERPDRSRYMSEGIDAITQRLSAGSADRSHAVPAPYFEELCVDFLSKRGFTVLEPSQTNTKNEE